MVEIILQRTTYLSICVEISRINFDTALILNNEYSIVLAEIISFIKKSKIYPQLQFPNTIIVNFQKIIIFR